MSGTEIKLTQAKGKTSASLLPNNLVYNGHYYAYLSRNEVHLIDHKSNLFDVEKAEKTLKGSYADKEIISTLAFCTLEGTKALVVVSQVGTVAVFEEDGDKLLATHKLQKSQVALSVQDAFLRGIACNEHNNLYFGSGSGDVLCFKYVKGKLALQKKGATHFARAVWTIAYDTETSLLAAGDENGNVTMFSTQGDNLMKVWDCKGSGMPITTMAMRHGVLITGDVTGKIRQYSLTKQALRVEIAAHARVINAVALHPTKHMLVAVSEDAHISVWTVATSSQSSVRSLLMYSPAPALLTGVVFSGKNAEHIVCTAYDSKSLYMIKTPPL